MKKTINAAIGGCSFIIDDDAYETISVYLENFKGALDNSSSSADVMDELEVRIADLLKSQLGGREVVDNRMATEVVGLLGYPANYSPSNGQTGTREQAGNSQYDNIKPVRKLFRDPDGKRIAGVCSGLALYLGIDVVVIRILFLIALICGSAGFWIYLVVWIAAPEARTAAEKCELRGIPATAENIRRFTEGK
ncbi:MAG: PspC domain-containing protein [Bacteroidales bacterium]|nr:PspC domain-containing protein [Bacteroidales bacterium]